jgi:ABC-type bacteriocin/lantibiotic exporter with double-glycine peptidase domain
MINTDQEKLTPTQRFWRLLKPDQREIKNVYTYAVFHGLVNLSLPLGIQAIVNLIQGGKINTSWIILVSLVVLGIALSGILQILQLRITENLQQKIYTRAAFEFTLRVPRIKMEELYKQYAPELMNRFFDIMSVQKGLSKILIEFSSASLQVIFGLILLSFYHPFFILFSFLLVLLVVIIFRLTAKSGLKSSLMESKRKYQTAHWLEEIARTNITFKLAGSSDLTLRKTDENVSRYLDARESHFQILIKQYSLLVVFKVLVALGLLAIGGILVMQQLMNIGQFVAAEIIIVMTMNSVEKLVLSLETIYDVLTGLEKVGQVTDLELEDTEGIDLDTSKYENGIQLNVKDLTYKYPDQKYPVLKDINLSLAAGKSMMIVGANGSGKSSLLHLIAGLYEIGEGQIMYDEFTKTSISIKSLRAIIGDCLSQEMLFQGTVRENICMGRSTSLNRLKEVADQLNLTKFINTLDRGFDSVIDPQGKRLPRSIVQKILIARAIAGRPKLLIVEENLEMIDEEERVEIVDYLTDPKNGWTLVAVSADEYFKSKVDTILELEEGKVKNIKNNKEA